MIPVNDFIEDTLRSAGSGIRRAFGTDTAEERKETQSHIVTLADRESERIIVTAISQAFPQDGIIAEESGYSGGSSGCQWIVDPLDGTSNFAAGIPWFGVLLARTDGGSVTHAGIYLPVDDRLYMAEKGRGSTVNGRTFTMKRRNDPSVLLCGFQADYSADEHEMRLNLRRFELVNSRFRNVRMTNSCTDFDLLLHGSTGALIGTCSKVWDIAAPSLLVTESGGTITDLSGKSIPFGCTGTDYLRNVTFLAAEPQIHAGLLPLLTV